jgi:plastocyanin
MSILNLNVRRHVMPAAVLLLVLALSISAALLSGVMADDSAGPAEESSAAQEAPPAGEGAAQQVAPPMQPADSFLVRMEDNVFVPQELVVPAGTMVTWVNAGADDHTIVAKDLSFDSGVVKPGQSWQRLFEFPGEYPYLCDLHEGMEGKIVVVQ